MDEFEIYAFGHPNILANHKTTWQITSEEDITPKGDCIIGVKASASTLTLPNDFKNKLRSEIKLQYLIYIGTQTILEGEAYGSRELTLNDGIDIVVRKSNFLSPRTIAIRSSKSANDIPRVYLKALQDPSTMIKIKFRY